MLITNLDISLKNFMILSLFCMEATLYLDLNKEQLIICTGVLYDKGGIIQQTGWLQVSNLVNVKLSSLQSYDLIHQGIFFFVWWLLCMVDTLFGGYFV